MQYLLPCSCGQKLTVDQTQAGLQIPCACGKSLEVPTLRGLKSLEPAANVRPLVAPENPWGPRQGVIFLGVVIALCGAALCGIMWYQRSPYDQPQVNMKALHDSTQQLTLEQSFQAWTDIKTQGLDRNPAPQLAAWQQMMEWNNRWLGVGVAAIGAGAVMMISALMSGRKTPRKAPAPRRAPA